MPLWPQSSKQLLFRKNVTVKFPRLLTLWCIGVNWKGLLAKVVIPNMKYRCLMVKILLPVLMFLWQAVIEPVRHRLTGNILDVSEYHSRGTQWWNHLLLKFIIIGSLIFWLKSYLFSTQSVLIISCNLAFEILKKKWPSSSPHPLKSTKDANFVKDFNARVKTCKKMWTTTRLC